MLVFDVKCFDTRIDSTGAALKAEERVEGVGCGLVSGAESLDLGLSILTGGLGGVVGLADVGKLVADTVGDDVGVQGVLLALGDEGIGGQEGELIGFASGAAGNEVNGGNTETEVEAGDGRLLGTGDGSSSLSLIGVGLLSISSGGSGGSTSTVHGGSGTSINVDVGGSIGSTGGSSGIDGLALDGEVGEALGNHDLSDRQAGGVEGSLDGGGRVGVLDIGASNGRVDQRNNAPESLSGRERGISTDVGDAHGEGVEVLLSGNEADGGEQDIIEVTELSNNLIGKRELHFKSALASFLRIPAPSSRSYLIAGAGSSKQDSRNLAGECASSTGGTTVGKTLDGSNRKLLLAEAGLGNSQNGGDDDSLRHLGW
jgi:hypothetical protein